MLGWPIRTVSVLLNRAGHDELSAGTIGEFYPDELLEKAGMALGFVYGFDPTFFTGLNGGLGVVGYGA